MNEETTENMTVGTTNTGETDSFTFVVTEPTEEVAVTVGSTSMQS